MPDKICPVVDAYLRHAREHWLSDPNASALYWSAIEGLEELRESPLAQIQDPATQKLRGFFCLHGLFVLLRTRLGGPTHQLPLTREGINSLIDFCSKARDSEEVKIYVNELMPKGTGIADLEKWQSQLLIQLTDTIVRAGEYFRPRLRSDGPVGSMGRYYAYGLICVRAPADRFVTHARELLNVSNMNRGDIGDE